MRKAITVVVALLMSLGFLVVPALSQEATDSHPGNVSGNVSIHSGSMTSPDTGGYQTGSLTSQSAGQSGNSSGTISGRGPLGGSPGKCMGGAGGVDSGSAASGMGSCASEQPVTRTQAAGMTQ